MGELPDVRLIAAVGIRGQLGLGGKTPWEDRDDLAFFRNATWGGVVIFGRRTAKVVGRLPGRDIVTWDGKTAPSEMIAQSSLLYPSRPIWIGGGAWTYKSFMHWARFCFVTRIAYDGPADVWMPPLWKDRNETAG